MILVNCAIKENSPTWAVLDIGSDVNCISQKHIGELGITYHSESNRIETPDASYSTLGRLIYISALMIRDTINWVDRSSPPSSPVLEPKKDKVPAPTQGDSSTEEYIKMIKLYASATGSDLRSGELKKAFFNGLSLDNKKRAIRFRTNEPLDKLVEFLVRMTPPTGTSMGLEQGNDSVEDFYKKLRENTKLSRWGERECKYQFIHGLSSANQLEARLCGLYLPLDELVDRLVKLEALKRHSG
ncbi:hypothetical protein GLOIN_2v1829228 [Rhizophagus clarus]|uniref:Uncharacterized protein n=1 Tax=Rhizophagus clarus TaxID=94130 RepID=A0A8H3KX88_9GLOM|nr:hypothetical protein GLOIN_2v1829228 [Rhizophagus clarus]